MREVDSPYAALVAIFLVQAIAAYVGDLCRRRLRPLRSEERADFDLLRAAALTLLGLIIGFSFAMAVSRYDQRKNLEEAEANAIGTEYLRADLLPAEVAARVRHLLRSYIDLRILYYDATDKRRISEINADTAKVQAAMWSAVANLEKDTPSEDPDDRAEGAGRLTTKR